MGKNVIISTLPNISQNYLPKVNTSNIFANSLVYDNGTNVMVNTTATHADYTNARLVVNNTGNSYLEVRGDGGQGTIALTTSTSTTSNFPTVEIFNSADFGIVGYRPGVVSSNYIMYYELSSSTNRRLTFQTEGVTRLAIQGAGRILMGPTLPTDDGSTALQVNGGGKFSNTVEIFDNTNSGILRLSRDAGGQRGALIFGRNNGGTFQTTGQIVCDSDTASVNNGVMSFWTSNSSGVNTQRLTITGTGAATFSSDLRADGTDFRFGGNYNPTIEAGRTAFNINGSSNAMISFTVAGTLKGYLYHNSTNLNLWNSVNGNVFIATDNTTRLTITGGGNVIIGNTTAYGGLTISDFTANDGNDSLSFFYRGTTGNHESLIKFYDFRGQVNAAIGNNLEDDGSGTQKARLVFKTSNNGTPTERMRITSGGNTLFGGTTFTTITSAVLGATNPSFTGRNWSFGPNSSGDYVVYHNAGGGNTGVYLTYGGTSWTSNSDINLKNITSEITNATEKLKNIRAVNFTWKEDLNNKEQVGVIAQDVQEVLPSLVDTNSEGYLGVRYTELIPVLVKAIQEQQAQIEEQKADIESLKALINK